MTRFALLVLFAAAFTLPAAAFHSGGVGECTGCHAIHRPLGEPAGAGDNAALAASDPGSVCLGCHLKAGETRPVSPLVATADADMPQGVPPAQLSPAGDFGWLKKSYAWGPSGEEGGGTSSGDGHGHNIVAADYRFAPDRERSAAPGGIYPSAGLTCISCHDPHGKYRRNADGSIAAGGTPIEASGSYDTSPDPTGTRSVGVYRLLGGRGYFPASGGGTVFASDPPSAVAPENYNRTEGAGDTRVAYGKGMSEWCANCHPALLAAAGGHKSHPAGNNVKFSSNTAANYNAYVASGNLTGSSAASYSSMVPFELGTPDYAVLKATARSSGTPTVGPTPSANVMCLSCHRAHASGWDHAARWNTKSRFLVYDGKYPGVDDGGAPPGVSQGRTRAEVKKTFGDRPETAYATYQRSLCNKCHARD